MANDNDISRRGLLKFGAMSALAIGSSKVLGLGALDCQTTPAQVEGPFYPIAPQADTNTDLTVIEGSSKLALGEIIYLSGKVVDQNCDPVAGCTVEIWQACVSGKYNHPGDRANQSPLDPNFQYWGIALTDNEGKYSFKTIIPGHYNATATWVRPPHIHFKIHKTGIAELTTQMYFKGNRYNSADLILNRIPAGERDSVVREYVARANEGDRRAYDVTFDIVVEKLV